LSDGLVWQEDANPKETNLLLRKNNCVAVCKDCFDTLEKVA